MTDDRFDKRLRFAYAVLVARTLVTLAAIAGVVLVAHFAGSWPTGMSIIAAALLVGAMERSIRAAFSPGSR